MGESVTWRGRHFGFMLRHTSKVTRYEPPDFFQDVMTAGMFSGFEHDHRFQQQNDETVVNDELRFTAPLGIFGLAAERLVLRNYLTRFLRERNAFVKEIAESDRWHEYLSKTPITLLQE